MWTVTIQKRGIYNIYSGRYNHADADGRRTMDGYGIFADAICTRLARRRCSSLAKTPDGARKRGGAISVRCECRAILPGRWQLPRTLGRDGEHSTSSSAGKDIGPGTRVASRTLDGDRTLEPWFCHSRGILPRHGADCRERLAEAEYAVSPCVQGSLGCWNQFGLTSARRNGFCPVSKNSAPYIPRGFRCGGIALFSAAARTRMLRRGPGTTVPLGGLLRRYSGPLSVATVTDAETKSVLNERMGSASLCASRPAGEQPGGTGESYTGKRCSGCTVTYIYIFYILNKEEYLSDSRSWVCILYAYIIILLKIFAYSIILFGQNITVEKLWELFLHFIEWINSRSFYLLM